MLLPPSSCLLSLQLVRVPLFPEPRVPTASSPATSQAFGSLGDQLDVCRIRNVVGAVPAQGPGLYASSVVDNQGHRLKMIRINTRSHSAQMIKLETGRDWASMMDPETSMSDGRAVLLTTQYPVTVSVYRSLPDPATSFVHHVSGPTVYQGFGHIPKASGREA